MRLLIVAAAVAAFSLPALAQQGRPQQRQQPAQPQQTQPAQQQQQDTAPGMFACRTEAELCFIAIAVSNTQVSVLYTNDPAAEDVDTTPINAQGADLGPHQGRVVMLTGQYNKASGLSNVQVVDVAGPLLSFAIKSMLSGEEEEEPEPPPPPQRQPQRQQQRR